MHSIRLAIAASAVLVASACDSARIIGGENSPSAVRVINASSVPLDVYVDGVLTAPGLTIANVSAAIPVTTGTHQIRLQAPSGSRTDLVVETTAGATVTTVATSPAATTVAARVLSDTGGIVPSGKSKLRVAHLAQNAGAIEIWRTQPDFQTPIHIMTPFGYQATSPYLQSDPGNWEVFVTAAGGTTRLVSTGLVNVPAGDRRTVVLLDSAGVLRLRVFAE